MIVAFACRVVTRLDLPHLLPSEGIQGDQVGVGGTPVDLVTVDRDAAVAVVGLGQPDVLGIVPRMDPDDVSAGNVEGHDPTASFGHVHESVCNDRRRNPPTVVPHRVRPDQSQFVHVRPVDLIQRTETGHVVRSSIAHPVAVFRVEQALLRDRFPLRRVRLRERRGGRRQSEQERP